MFCQKCGKELKDGSRFCVYCGCAQDEPIPEAPEQAEPQAPVSGSIELNPMEDKPKKHMGKKGKIALIISSVVVVAAVVAVVLCWGSIKNLFIRNGSPDTYLKTVEMNDIEQLTGSVGTAYDEYRHLVVDERSGVQAQARIMLGSQFLSAMQSALDAQGVDLDLSFLDNLQLNLEHWRDGSTNFASLALGVGDSRVAGLEYVLDLDALEMWYRIPEVSKHYLYANLRDVFGQMGFDGSRLQMQLESALETQQILAVLPDGRTLAGLLDKYAGILLDSLGSVEKSQDTLELNGLTQECTVLQMKVTEKIALDTSVRLLTAVKEDQVLLKSVRDLCQVLVDLDMTYEDTAEELYAEFLEELDDMLEDLQDNLSQADEDPEYAIVYRCYVDKSNQVIGRRLEIPGEDAYYYYTVSDGDDFQTVLDFGDLGITGSGTAKGNVLSGDYKIDVQGMNFLNFSLDEINRDALTTGKLIGTVSISLGSDLSQMAGQTGNSQMDMTLRMVELKLECRDNACTVSINLAGTMLAGIQFSGKPVSGKSIEVPTERAFSILDQDSLEQWLNTMDLNPLIKNMTKAGLPRELIDSLKQAAEELESLQSSYR